MEENCFEPANVRIDVEKLIDGIEDVTDPSSMEKILDYVERGQEEDANFMELLITRLRHVDIYWNVPWYQQKISLCKTEYDEIDETNPYRTDTISQDEHELIEKNWNRFRKKFHLPDQIISLARWKNMNGTRNPTQSPEERARRFAVAYLSRGLKRTTYQVFTHISSYYGGYRKGYFSEAEQKIIDICFHHKPKLIASMLSFVLGRQVRGVYKRLRHLTHGKPEKQRLKWTLSRASTLVQHLLKYIEVELIDLKDRQIETWVWHRLEEEFEQNTGHLQHFWYCQLHAQIFVKCDIKLNKLRKKLFKLLQAKASDSTYKIWSDIRWKDIFLHMPDGLTPRFVYRICNIFARSLEGYRRKPLQEVVEYSLQKLKKQNKNKRLKRLRFNEHGQLEPVNYKS